MRASKAEIAAYIIGGLAILGGFGVWYGRRKKHPGDIYPQMFIFGGGLLLTGGALSIHRATSKQLSGGLGLSEVARSTSRSGATTRLWHDKNMDVQERVVLLQGLVAKSIRDPDARRLALAITGHGKRKIQVGRETVDVKGRGCEARDDTCELQAIFNFTADPKNLRYTGDTGAHVVVPGQEPEAVDFFATVRRAIENRGEDCLPAGTLLLNDSYETVPIEKVKVGSKIWGLNRWSTVERVWYKGELPVDAVQLSNGSWIKATPDHKVYVAKCPRHLVKWESGGSCNCLLSERSIERIHVRDLEEGMVLVAPDRIPFGQTTMDPDRALVEGFYLSDGWSSHTSRFDISGRDGHPKEEQKRLIEEVCNRLGVTTTWHHKHISILDPEWAQRVRQMGKYAPEKHALSLDLDEGAAGALLRGIMADSDVRDHQFTTTSQQLMLQVRLLHRMFGITCGLSYIEDHGGLGENPIWRLYPRKTDGTSNKKFLRVKKIERSVAILPVYDISTDDHYVYLPAADVTVSNCDGHSVVNASLAALNGFPVRFRITSNTGATWDHIYGLAGIPKLDPKKWIALDTTLGEGKFGIEPSYAKHVDFDA